MIRSTLNWLLFVAIAASGWLSVPAYGQSPADTVRLSDAQLDSLFIDEVQDRRTPDKVLHAEPLYIDLIRDLGARKGEREWNVGLSLTDNLRYDTYQALVEYEWAPANRLGMEVELPFSFHQVTNREPGPSAPSSGLDGLKTAVQWSFYVSERHKTTLALGYINELKLTTYGQWATGPWLKGNQFNPFLVAARRWGNRFHTLIYTGPRFTRYFAQNEWKRQLDINTNLHYMIPGTRNFVGLELNKEIQASGFTMVARPQLRVGITDQLLVGIVTGIPFNRDQQRLSSFLRLIYEPGHRHRG
ncbi:HAEPLYID family protein [Rudanella lutea]|uniref:HAEPLYID family protein n=1 Tax=Rudanella lutea TaxID=451374 RepID=UPI000377F352|nr:HAEPLYID family protein [Rudanella lutea]